MTPVKTVINAPKPWKFPLFLADEAVRNNYDFSINKSYGTAILHCHNSFAFKLVLCNICYTYMEHISNILPILKECSLSSNLVQSLRDSLSRYLNQNLVYFEHNNNIDLHLLTLSYAYCKNLHTFCSRLKTNATLKTKSSSSPINSECK